MFEEPSFLTSPFSILVSHLRLLQLQVRLGGKERIKLLLLAVAVTAAVAVVAVVAVVQSSRLIRMLTRE
jgi:hypothetical protein